MDPRPDPPLDPLPILLPVPTGPRPGSALTAAGGADRLIAAFLSSRSAQTLRAYQADLRDFARFQGVDARPSPSSCCWRAGTAVPTRSR